MFFANVSRILIFISEHSVRKFLWSKNALLVLVEIYCATSRAQMLGWEIWFELYFMWIFDEAVIGSLSRMCFFSEDPIPLNFFSRFCLSFVREWNKYLIFSPNPLMLKKCILFIGVQPFRSRVETKRSVAWERKNPRKIVKTICSSYEIIVLYKSSAYCWKSQKTSFFFKGWNYHEILS